ncbi:hypothetical protein BKA66DRAFT_437925 [Pyrenochaeta sp. MPI-SDFR-AT-0127]|nr:hypothetical protein BKA66DRAFT_437925 [Pyrenochaeta sp. MPI-SDFR-AT-0127]
MGQRERQWTGASEHPEDKAQETQNANGCQQAKERRERSTQRQRLRVCWESPRRARVGVWGALVHVLGIWCCNAILRLPSPPAPAAARRASLHVIGSCNILLRLAPCFTMPDSAAG